MDIISLFERGMKQGLFTDFDVCVEGSFKMRTTGGIHVAEGAKLFDIASLTKACTHLEFLRLFSTGQLCPEDSFARFVPVPQHSGDDRKLWHFLTYTVGSYGFEYQRLREGQVPSLREELVSKGFGPWDKRFRYDNIGSVYLGLLLEKMFDVNLEVVLHEHLLRAEFDSRRFVFHPVSRG